MGLVTELPRHGPGVKEHMVGIENRLLVEPAPVSIRPTYGVKRLIVSLFDHYVML